MATSDSKFVIVLEAGEKFASKTGELSRIATDRLLRARLGLGQWRAIVEKRDDSVVKIGEISQSIRSAIAWLSKLRSELEEEQAIIEARRGVLFGIRLLSNSVRSGIDRLPLLRSRLGEERAIVKARKRVFVRIVNFSGSANSTNNRALKVREKVAAWGLFAAALEKVTVSNDYLSQFGRTVAGKAAQAGSKLSNSGQNVRESVADSRGGSYLRSATHGIKEFTGRQNLWVVVGLAIVIVVTARLVTSALADSSRELLVGSGGRDRSGAVQEAPLVDSSQGPFTFPETPQAPGIVLPFELLLVAPTPDPANDFEGAQVLGVTHLSATSSMMHINAPGESEGVYRAVLTTSEELEFQCLTLEGYANRLYCVGPRLQEGSLIGVRIFRVDMDSSSQVLIFETEYQFRAVEGPVVPTPFAPTTYGGGFTWPDRFDGAQIQRERQSSKMLWPLSALIVLAPLVYRILTNLDHKHRRRLVEKPAFDPAH